VLACIWSGGPDACLGDLSWVIAAIVLAIITASD
jgi:hypothetical protein